MNAVGRQSSWRSGGATSNALLSPARSCRPHRPLHTQAWAATRQLARQRRSAVGLHLRNPSLMDYYSFNRPRRDRRLSRPCWLTDSGRFTHNEVIRPAASLAQDRESTPAEPAVLTTMPRHQLNPSHIFLECASACFLWTTLSGVAYIPYSQFRRCIRSSRTWIYLAVGRVPAVYCWQRY